MSRVPLRRSRKDRRPIQQITREVHADQDAGLTSRQRRTRDWQRDREWRAEVLLLRGHQCRVVAHLLRIPPIYRTPEQRGLVASCDGRIEVDHMIPRRPSTRWAVPNGLPLCSHHHRLKTGHLLLIDPAWLDLDQVQWLAEEGHVEWCWDGIVVGQHRRLFADGPDRRREGLLDSNYHRKGTNQHEQDQPHDKAPSGTP